MNNNTATLSREEFAEMLARPRKIAKAKREAGQAMRRALTLELQAPMAHASGEVRKAALMLAQAKALRCECRRLTDLAESIAAQPLDF